MCNKQENNSECPTCNEAVKCYGAPAPIPSTRMENINSRISRELSRSITKHGNWDDLDFIGMLEKIYNEMQEIGTAILCKDYFGEHGAFNELAQVAACCQKAMAQILKREGLYNEK